MAFDSNFITYPLLLIAMYFEIFLLVTFLSRPAREQRARRAATHTPNVAIIVPCWNEESTIATTTASLLKLSYPKKNLSIVLVNDGSTDGTATAMQRFATNPQIITIHKENGGKHTALNAGIAAVPNAEFIGCLDADSFVDSSALREIIACFDKKEVMATTASMSIYKPHTIFQRMQYAEYIFGITVRHILSSINSLYVTPGPFSLYRAEVFKKLGGFIHGHQTEDMEMALRIQRAGYSIENALRARVYTKAPETLPKLLKQRIRWTTGFLRNITSEYRGLLVNPQHGALGVLILPFAVFSIAGGILLFLLSFIQITQSISHALFVTEGVPLSYTLTPHVFNWFYLPVTGAFLMGSVLIATTFLFMIIGKRLSHTPGNLMSNVAVYALLYGITAPLWLIASVTDVARGARRTWR